MENKGAWIAAAVAGLFASGAVPALAQEKDGEQVMCSGINACKGKGSCAGAGNSCAGQNACKGHGNMKVSKKDCLAKGGKVVPKASK